MESTTNAAEGDATGQALTKKPRKSRGRGLRTTTGCLTCRKRHKKCDENVPICGPCSIARRACTYPNRDALRRAGPGSSQSADRASEASRPRNSSITVSDNDPERVSARLGRPDDGNHPSVVTAAEGQEGSPAGLAVGQSGAAESLPAINYRHQASHVQTDSDLLVDPGLPIQSLVHHSPALSPPGLSRAGLGLSAKEPHQDFACSPAETASSSELLGAGLASTRWLDLLAADAAQADSTFSLVQTPAPYDYGGPNGDAAAWVPQTSAGELEERLAELASGDDRDRWQAHSDIQLQSHEATLFRLFAERCASWLDVFDTFQHFSTYVTHLAMRNHGLMKAILALSARYAVASPAHAILTVAPAASPPAHINLAMQYYYETLHYVSTALHHQSYAHSEELLATALVISTYEMLDAARADGPDGGEGGDSGSNNSNTEAERSGRAALSNWQRHLKGVFWIQRSQNVNGASGGLRQAVWWAWLQQDIWAAFREHRRCFSFWAWKTPIRQVPQHDLAALSMYLLKDAVNYCADDPMTSAAAGGATVPVLDADALRRRVERGVDLMAKLEQWQACLGINFKPLPSSAANFTSGKYPCSAWVPIWVHPPRLAVALQAHSFAKILVCLHQPPTSGFQGFLRKQRILATAVATICGLAMEMTDKGCQIVSAQCLFGAGLCVDDKAQQDTIVSLIDECEARCGWPMSGLHEDLRKEWSHAAT